MFVTTFDTPQIGIAYAVLTSVLFVFPPELPVTGSNMNYCIVAFALVLIISTVQWFIDGRKNYSGPQLDMDAMRKGQVVGVPGDNDTDNVTGRVENTDGTDLRKI